MKYISPLTKKQLNDLNDMMARSRYPRQIHRCFGIILSSHGIKIDKISIILEVDRDTVSSWIDRWNETGIKGLTDRNRSGRPKKAAEE